MSAEIAVLAGGLATRLGERTQALPKSLLRVGDRPFIAWQLERLAQCGFSRVVVCIAHLGEQIRQFVGNGNAFGVDVVYSEDGPMPLGTGGALRNAAPLLADRFVVTYGDSYLPFDYRAPLEVLQRNPDRDGCLAVFRNQGRWDESNTRVENERVLAYRKGAQDASFDHIDYGAMALQRRVLLAYEAGVRFELDALQSRLAERGRLAAFVAQERFYEIGSEHGIRELEQYLATRASY